MRHVCPGYLLVNYSILVWSGEVNLVEVWKLSLRQWSSRLRLGRLVQLLHLLLLLNSLSRRRRHSTIWLVILAKGLILNLREILLRRKTSSSISWSVSIQWGLFNTKWFRGRVCSIFRRLSTTNCVFLEVLFLLLIHGITHVIWIASNETRSLCRNFKCTVIIKLIFERNSMVFLLFLLFDLSYNFFCSLRD